MKPVPHEFFIDLTDYFSVLLSGALLTWLMMGRVGPVVLGHRHAKLDGAQAWAAFLFASYPSATWSFCSAPGWTSSKAGPSATR